jgi:hypothetical protein
MMPKIVSYEEARNREKEIISHWRIWHHTRGVNERDLLERAIEQLKRLGHSHGTALWALRNSNFEKYKGQ